jgi:hypothetical protein
MEKEDMGRSGLGGMKSSADGDIFCNGYHHVGGVLGHGTGGFGSGVEQVSGYFRSVEDPKGGVGRVGHVDSFLLHRSPAFRPNRSPLPVLLFDVNRQRSRRCSTNPSIPLITKKNFYIYIKRFLTLAEKVA